MKFSRSDLLQTLELVSAGISPQNIVTQSNCFVFQDGKVFTYNDELACSADCKINFSGAVQASSILPLIQKLQEDFLDIQPGEGEIRLVGKGRRAGITCEQEISLPLKNVDPTDDAEWKPLPEDFDDAVDIVACSAGHNDSEFVLTCLHFAKGYVEACDNFQMTRHKLKLPLESDLLIRSEAVKRVVGFGANEFCETASWIHFRNEAGATIACRRYVHDYPKLAEHLKGEGEELRLPAGLEEAVAKANIFASDDAGTTQQVKISLGENKITIEGRGVGGWYQERHKIKYTGQSLAFVISPKLLSLVLARKPVCMVCDGKLLVDEGKFRFAACFGEPS